MKASSVVAPAKVAREKPDLEEALDESDDDASMEVDATETPENGDEELDLKRDKYIKAPKKKAAPKATGGAKGKKKKRAADDDDEDMESEEEKPKKKGKGKAKK
jgi:replication factor C subunit 1